MMAFLQFPWSVVHYIDDDSPLAEYVHVGTDGAPRPSPLLADDHVEIIVTVLGTAPATGNTFESRASYTTAESSGGRIRFGHRFADALKHSSDPRDRTLS
eukprot:3745879-Prymnesium_polylepis.1